MANFLRALIALDNMAGIHKTHKPINKLCPCYDCDVAQNGRVKKIVQIPLSSGIFVNIYYIP